MVVHKSSNPVSLMLLLTQSASYMVLLLSTYCIAANVATSLHDKGLPLSLFALTPATFARF